MPTTYAIPDGRTVMAATLWSGDNTTSRLISTAVNGVSFQPDFVWVKARNNTREHILEDSVRGLSYNNELSSNSAGQENSNPTAGGVTGASSTTITLGGTGTMDNVNKSTWTYVGWQWKAGGTAVSNTAGTIPSSVSANPTAGFSVVTYTGTSANGTVGHGLTTAPSMIICKSRTSSNSWVVYHASLGNTQYLVLNGTGGAGTLSTFWNNTSPTTTAPYVFSVGSASNVNQSGDAQLAYCFAPVAGYSAFGSYTGNSSTDGTFVYLGFRPRFVMVKGIGSGGSGWQIQDSSRNTYNPEDAVLRADLSNQETTAYGTVMDFLSNGFKLRVSDTNYNSSSTTYGPYIYMAFAENPFKYANAR